MELYRLQSSVRASTQSNDQQDKSLAELQNLLQNGTRTSHLTYFIHHGESQNRGIFSCIVVPIY